MDQRDPASKKAADEHVLGIAHFGKHVVDEAAPRMRPPVSTDGFAKDRLDQSWCAALRRREHDTLLSHELERRLGRELLAHELAVQLG